MKAKRKLSTRERWVLAIAPSVAIVGIYAYCFAGDLAANLDKETKRVAAASAPAPPAGPPAGLVKAKKAFEDTTRDVADRQASNEQLEALIATLPKSLSAIADDHDRAREIERIEAVFARNGITPIISEPAGDGELGDQTLLAVLAPRLEGETPLAKPPPRVWHCIFDDSMRHFKVALSELTRTVPAVIPLTFNLVYNPDNNGQSRLLELWILY